MGKNPSLSCATTPPTTETLRDGIRGAEEVVLANAGHMFRFTHPHRYEQAVSHFIETRVPQRAHDGAIVTAP